MKAMSKGETHFTDNIGENTAAEDCAICYAVSCFPCVHGYCTALEKNMPLVAALSIKIRKKTAGKSESAFIALSAGDALICYINTLKRWRP